MNINRVAVCVGLLVAAMCSGCLMTTGGVTSAIKEGIAMTPYGQPIDKALGAFGYTADGAKAPKVRDMYVDKFGNEYTNGVYKVETYQSIVEVIKASSGPVVVTPPLPPAVIPAATVLTNDAAIKAIGERLP